MINFHHEQLARELFKGKRYLNEISCLFGVLLTLILRNVSGQVLAHKYLHMKVQ